jgi:cyanophycinase
MRWFQSLGATDVVALPLIDSESANDPRLVAALRRSQVIYILGGFPHYLGQTLLESAAWQAMLSAYEKGAIIGGSSAGAMVLCEYYYNPTTEKVHEGLGLLPGACILPHHNTSGKSWAERLKRLLPDTVLIGIDEETGMLNDGPHGMWQIYGKGNITLYKGNLTECVTSGRPFDLYKVLLM